MKNFACIISAFCFLCSAFALNPAMVTVTNIRDEAEANISSTEFVRGESLLFTNCVAYSGSSTSSVKENLTGLTVVISIGIPSTNNIFTGTTQIATNGTWYATVTVPTNWDTPWVEIKLTNSTTVYSYPLKTMKTRTGF